MTAIASVAGPAPMTCTVQGQSPSAQTLPKLSEPTVEGFPSQDAMAMMLISMEKASQASMAQTEQRIATARTEIRAQLEDQLKQVREAIEAARKASEDDDDDGWLGSVVSCVADTVGEIVGTAADFVVDTVTLPVDLTVGLAKSFEDPGAFMRTLQSEAQGLVSNGDTANSVKGFTKGTIEFCGDLAIGLKKIQLALPLAVLTGESLLSVVKKDAVAVWNSFEKNILDNPGFWDVAAALGKAALVATAALTGGATAVIVIGLVALDEVEKRTGAVSWAVGEVAGKQAASWVRPLIQAGLAVCSAYVAGVSNSALISGIQGGVAVAQGAETVYQGYQAIEAADRKADALEQQAEMLEVGQRMQRMQRLVEELIALLTEQNDDQKTSRQMGNDLMQTHGAMQSAALMRA